MWVCWLLVAGTVTLCLLQVKAEIRQLLLSSIGDPERKLRATIVRPPHVHVAIATIYSTLQEQLYTPPFRHMEWLSLPTGTGQRRGLNCYPDWRQPWAQESRPWSMGPCVCWQVQLLLSSLTRGVL